MSDSFCYVGIKPCGCVTCIAVEEVFTEEDRRDWESYGCRVERVSVTDGRNRLKNCNCKTPTVQSLAARVRELEKALRALLATNASLAHASDETLMEIAGVCDDMGNPSGARHAAAIIAARKVLNPEAAPADAK